MSDIKYTRKENARSDMEQAITDYKVAAADYGLDDYDIASEINDACHEAGVDVKITCDT